MITAKELLNVPDEEFLSTVTQEDFHPSKLNISDLSETEAGYLLNKILQAVFKGHENEIK